MRLRILTFSFVLFIAASVRGREQAVITNCHDLTEMFRNETRVAVSVDLTARAILPPNVFLSTLVIEDSSGGVVLQTDNIPKSPTIRAGDTIRLIGTVDFTQRLSVSFRTLSILSHGKSPPPPEVTPDDIRSGRHDHRYVRLRGVITDIFLDEIDPRFLVLSVQSGDEMIYAFLGNGGTNAQTYARLARATVSICGVVTPDLQRYTMRHLGHTLGVPSSDCVTVLQEPDHTFPDIAALRSEAPSEIAKADRHQAVGRVLATWSGGMLLQTDGGDPCVVELAANTLPDVGETVCAVGFPTTDLYHVNLTRATWRRAGTVGRESESVIGVTAAEISRNGDGNICFKPWFHGQTLQLTGKIVPSDASRPGCFAVDDGTIPATIDASSLTGGVPDLEIGAVAEITGVCVLTTESWRQNATFPRFTGFRIVVRTADDIRIVSHPPWWTARRLGLAVYVLLAVLVGVMAVLFVLRRLLAKRSRELEAEIGARIESECLVQERTRLAVELHDSITQNLTGASLELRAAARSAGNGPSDVQQHLDLARMTVDSSLDDLRNCIWDLRNRALEEKDFADAIRKTLLPHVDAIDLLLRFNIPRELLSDNTAHAILCINRELTVNAVRHGHATQIRIAGAIEDRKLLFSVKDDGSGFDPDTRPRVRQGHFGLQGIEERLKAFGGVLSIESRPGAGTKVTVTIPLPHAITT